MTTVVINAISVKEGGSLVVLRELLTAMAELRPQWRWRVVVNSEAADRLPDFPGVDTLCFPLVEKSSWRVRLWYETGLPELLESCGADLLFSITNYLPRRRLPCPSLLLVQHAGHFSPVFCALTEAELNLPGRLAWRLKGHWVKSSVHRADAVTVQTEALRSALIAGTGCDGAHVQVVAHGIGLATLQPRPATCPGLDAPLRIGYITKPGVQKNFSVMFEAASLLLQRGLRPVLVLTLSESLPENQTVLESARQHGVAECIENHGELPPEAIGILYRSLHVFVFPSLSESFGFPLVEAMAYGIPLLTADTPSNIEVAGAGGMAFPAYDAEALACELARLAHDPGWFRLRAQASLARGSEFSWETAATETLSLMEAVMSEESDKYRSAELQRQTRAHYESFPFDFLTAEDEQNIENLQPAPFRRFVDGYLTSGSRVAEIGCGPGRGTLFMARRGIDLLAVDISIVSLHMAQRRAPSCQFVQATNLQLPLPDGSFDAVVSDGVIHHTPDAYRAFCENARILRPGGMMYVGVYRRRRYYYYVYRYIGPPLRWLAKRDWGKALIHATLVPIYYVVHLVKSGGKRTWQGAKHFFHDYIITPQATFHTREQLEEWGLKNGLEVISYDGKLGNIQVFVFCKVRNNKNNQYFWNFDI